jgi:CPA1 family monovalent cation:H+ antiporter
MQIDLVTGLVFTCIFLIGICAIEHHFRFSRLPYICWVVLFGVAYGLLDARVWRILPDLNLTSDVILYICLPILIFDSSRKLDLGQARRVALPSFLLASIGLLISMFVMATPLHLFKGIPWRDALFFTAIMSATDPVAVSAIFGRFRVPERLKTLIEGESLLNDGTSVILFIVLGGIAVEGRALLVPRELLFFVASIGGAVLVGSLAGWCGVWVMRKWRALDDHFVGPLLPLLIIYLIFCGTQAGLEISGVIAVMAATLTMRILGRHLPAAERPRKADMAFYRGLWDFLGELVNAVLFFMLAVIVSRFSVSIP